jgi:hypothetical protein
VVNKKNCKVHFQNVSLLNTPSKLVSTNINYLNNCQSPFPHLGKGFRIGVTKKDLE